MHEDNAFSDLSVVKLVLNIHFSGQLEYNLKERIYNFFFLSVKSIHQSLFKKSSYDGTEFVKTADKNDLHT